MSPHLLAVSRSFFLKLTESRFRPRVEVSRHPSRRLLRGWLAATPHRQTVWLAVAGTALVDALFPSPSHIMRKLGRPPTLPTLKEEDHLSGLRDHIEKCGGRRSLVDGWGARLEYRSEGRTAGTHDLYYYHQNGKRFRSKVEVSRFFNLKDPRSRLSLPGTRLPSTARLARPDETPAASDAVNYAVPPPVRAGQFSIGTMLPGSDGKSRWQVAPRRDANGLVEWNCVDWAGFPLELQPKKRRLPAAPRATLKTQPPSR